MAGDSAPPPADATEARAVGQGSTSPLLVLQHQVRGALGQRLELGDRGSVLDTDGVVPDLNGHEVVSVTRNEIDSDEVSIRLSEEMMSDSTLASVTLPSLRAARSARDRLARAGFARNSINIDRHGDAFEVSINTREENRDRAERILTGSPLGNDLRQAGERTADFVQANQPLALGLAALAGFALFSLTSRR